MEFILLPQADVLHFYASKASFRSLLNFSLFCDKCWCLVFCRKCHQKASKTFRVTVPFVEEWPFDVKPVTTTQEKSLGVLLGDEKNILAFPVDKVQIHTHTFLSLKDVLAWDGYPPLSRGAIRTLASISTRYWVLSELCWQYGGSSLPYCSRDTCSSHSGLIYPVRLWIIFIGCWLPVPHIMCRISSSVYLCRWHWEPSI